MNFARSGSSWSSEPTILRTVSVSGESGEGADFGGSSPRKRKIDIGRTTYHEPGKTQRSRGVRFLSGRESPGGLLAGHSNGVVLGVGRHRQLNVFAAALLDVVGRQSRFGVGYGLSLNIAM